MSHVLVAAWIDKQTRYPTGYSVSLIEERMPNAPEEARILAFVDAHKKGQIPDIRPEMHNNETEAIGFHRFDVSFSYTSHLLGLLGRHPDIMIPANGETPSTDDEIPSAGDDTMLDAQKDLKAIFMAHTKARHQCDIVLTPPVKKPTKPRTSRKTQELRPQTR